MHQDKASSTALLIAKSQLLLSSNVVSDIRKGYYNACVEAFEKKHWNPKGLSRYYYNFIDRLIIPGIYLHYALRKLCIEDTSKSFLDKNAVQQVVVIAGGFDPLSAILSKEYKNVAFFELDHPATHKVKKTAITKLGELNNLTLIPADLTKESILDSLNNSTFSLDIPTLFIAEGITMYLDEKEVEIFFRQIRSCCKNKESYLIFTYMNKQPSNSIQFESVSKLVDYWLWIKKEVFKWGIKTSKLAEFIEKVNYKLVNIHDADYLIKQYLPDKKDAVIARGENIALAKIKC